MSTDQTPEQVEPPTGVQMDFVSNARSESMGTTEKINMILDRVVDDAVVILEEGLNPDEEQKLIERTMSRTDGYSFTGIEIETLQRGDSNSNGLLGRLVKRDDPPTLMIIGPAETVKTLERNESGLRALLQTTA